MASFTKIPEAETPSISVNPQHKISKINDNVYGGFTEYVACPAPPRSHPPLPRPLAASAHQAGDR